MLVEHCDAGWGQKNQSQNLNCGFFSNWRKKSAEGDKGYRERGGENFKYSISNSVVSAEPFFFELQV